MSIKAQENLKKLLWKRISGTLTRSQQVLSRKANRSDPTMMWCYTLGQAGLHLLWEAMTTTSCSRWIAHHAFTFPVKIGCRWIEWHPVMSLLIPKSWKVAPKQLLSGWNRIVGIATLYFFSYRLRMLRRLLRPMLPRPRCWWLVQKCNSQFLKQLPWKALASGERLFDSQKKLLRSLFQKHFVDFIAMLQNARIELHRSLIRGNYKWSRLVSNAVL